MNQNVKLNKDLTDLGSINKSNLTDSACLKKDIQTGTWGKGCMQVLGGERGARKDSGTAQMLWEDQEICKLKKMISERPASLEEKAVLNGDLYH